ncbi:MAG: sigma 54-interacting transcriptional regulator [Polyangiaceae bacterium]
MSSVTTPIESRPRIAVRTLAVEVLDGPDEGMRAEASSETLSVGVSEGNDLKLTDGTVSRFHLELTRDERGVRITDLGSTNGTFVGDLRIDRGTVPPGSEILVGRTRLRVDDGEGTTAELHAGEQLSELRGRTQLMRRLMARVGRVARASVPVLMIGESGTGKELVARAIHEGSERIRGPFVTVDCASLAPTLIASELFGHEKGAFTGAHRQHLGAFERANGGTLFLDEIGELPQELQPQLLGALERRRFRRVGGRHEIDVDVRVISATNRDLRSEVNAGTFRLDLYYRIAVVVLKIPPLRQRTEDIPILVEHFLREAGHDASVEEAVPAEVLASLSTYRWPGNVRELRNWVEATLAMGESPELLDDVAPPASSDDVQERLLELPYKDAREVILNDFEARYCGYLLERAEGNVTHAARLARMDRSYLIKLLQKHDLK